MGRTQLDCELNASNKFPQMATLDDIKHTISSQRFQLEQKLTSETNYVVILVVDRQFFVSCNLYHPLDLNIMGLFCTRPCRLGFLGLAVFLIACS